LLHLDPTTIAALGGPLTSNVRRTARNRKILSANDNVTAVDLRVAQQEVAGGKVDQRSVGVGFGSAFGGDRECNEISECSISECSISVLGYDELYSLSTGLHCIHTVLTIYSSALHTHCTHYLLDCTVYTLYSLS
jgi:hypothetical protein